MIILKKLFLSFLWAFLICTFGVGCNDDDGESAEEIPDMVQPPDTMPPPPAEPTGGGEPSGNELFTITFDGTRIVITYNGMDLLENVIINLDVHPNIQILDIMSEGGNCSITGDTTPDATCTFDSIGTVVEIVVALCINGNLEGIANAFIEISSESLDENFGGLFDIAVDALDMCEAVADLPCLDGVCTVFATSTTYNGDLITSANALDPTIMTSSGVDAADAICQYHADSATPQLIGTYKAWISDSLGNSPATNFVNNDTPYVLVDRTVIASSFSDLVVCGEEDELFTTLTGVPVTSCFDHFVDSDTPVFQDENGVDLDNSNSPFRVWTGTDEEGNFFNFGCDDWTSTGGSGTFGLTGTAGFGWSAFFSPTSCQAEYRLYCFQQDVLLTADSQNEIDDGMFAQQP